MMIRREKKPMHHVQMTDGKRAIIQQLLQEYEIEIVEDIQDALKDLFGGTIKEMMETEMEMDNHLGYGKSERISRDKQTDYKNGTKRKQVNTSYGFMIIDVPQDRNSTFEPQGVKNRQKNIFNLDQKIISMYAKEMITRQISDTLMDIYGFKVSEGFISNVIDKPPPQILSIIPLIWNLVKVYLDKIFEEVELLDNEVMRVGCDLEKYVARRLMEEIGKSPEISCVFDMPFEACFKCYLVEMFF